ncbi:MAG: DUF1311 domain-containing protein [Gemmatimonadaceae bacterium]|nr:DUF1311 domain-containing protein [Gemmatimonadaceae bacterium]
MIRSVRLVSLILCVGCNGAPERDVPASAQSAPGTITATTTHCDSATTTLAMRECGASDLASAERELEFAVDSLRARGADPSLVDSAQSAWRQSRRYDCALSGAPFAGGSLQGVEVATCMARLTRQRADQLSQLFRAP